MLDIERETDTLNAIYEMELHDEWVPLNDTVVLAPAQEEAGDVPNPELELHAGKIYL